MACNSANRDVVIDNFGAYGSKVLNVSIDASVISEIDETSGSWSWSVPGALRIETRVLL